MDTGDALWYRIPPVADQIVDEVTNSYVISNNSNFVLTNYQNSFWRPTTNWVLVSFMGSNTTDALTFLPKQTSMPAYAPGNIRASNMLVPHMVHAYNSSGGAFTNGQVHPFTNVLVNEGNCWATNTFTVKISGYYHLTSCLRTDATANVINTRWYLGESLLPCSASYSGSVVVGAKTAVSSTVVQAAPNDTLQLRNVNNGFLQTGGGAPQVHFITIRQIG
jgi:hypothetical protein